MGETRQRALMIYDGDCGFCTYWAFRWAEKLSPHLEVIALQDDEGHGSGIARQDLEEAVHLVEPSGEVFRGAAAVYRALSRRKRYAWMWWLYRRIPPFRWMSDIGYRWVANHRMLVSRWTRWMRRDRTQSSAEVDS